MKTDPTESATRPDPVLFPVSLMEIEPLLQMPDIAETARTFHKYADYNPEKKHDLSLPLTDYFLILWELSKALQDETIHLSSRHLMPGSTSFIMSNIAGCANLEDAMKLIAKSYNMLHGGPYNRVEQRDGDLLYIIDDSQFPYVPQKQDYIHFTMECVLIYLQGILSFITSRDLGDFLRKVHTKRDRGPVKSRHMQFWPTPIRYQSGQYVLTYDLSAAALPITIPASPMPRSREIYDHVIAMIRKRGATEDDLTSWTDRVSQALAHGLLSQQDVARHLGASVATLRRRLTEENSSFRELHQQCLNERSRQMITQGYHMADIAEELGFSDFRSFIRAFKGWNGITPTAFARKLRQGAP